jgi:hypothetical protein
MFNAATTTYASPHTATSSRTIIVTAAPAAPAAASAPTVTYGGSSGWSVPYVSTVMTTVSTSTSILPIASSTAVCSPYMLSQEYVRLGAANDVAVVKKLQTFLNKYEGTSLVVDGIYKQVDFEAVKSFQRKYTLQILAPWGHSTPTGYVYMTTVAKINAIVCGQSIGCPVFTKKTDILSTHTDVPRVKNFLNQLLGTKLNDSQTMDAQTVAAIRKFQTKYKDFILKPIGLSSATGLWYESTMKQANTFMGCSL